MAVYKRGSIKQFFRGDPTIKGYYPLNSNRDESGQNSHLTVRGTMNWGKGKFNIASNQNGGYAVDAGRYDDNARGLGADSPITLMCWAAINSQPGADVGGLLISMANGPVYFRWEIVYKDGAGTKYVIVDKNKFAVEVNSVSLQKTLSVGRFYLFALTFDGTNLKGYFDGKYFGSVVATGTGSNNYGNGFTVHGGWSNAATIQNGSDSKVEEATLFFRALSPTEIFAYYKWAIGVKKERKLLLSLISYSMTALAGTFVLTGIATLFTKALKLICDVGNFALTGISVGLSKGYKLVADVGNFVLTGIDALFKRGYGIVAETGSFVLTGIDTLFTKTIRLVCDTGNFVLTGIDVGLSKGYTIVANVGSFVLTGINVGLLKGYKLAASVGSFALTGISILFKITKLAEGGFSKAKSVLFPPAKSKLYPPSKQQY